MSAKSVQQILSVANALNQSDGKEIVIEKGCIAVYDKPSLDSSNANLSNQQKKN